MMRLSSLLLSLLLRLAPNNLCKNEKIVILWLGIFEDEDKIAAPVLAKIISC
jgi:hypothetical protein